MKGLRTNQKTAIQESIDNDFESGIHYHATGSGKSWIAIHILKAFNEKYPNKNVLWICERKDILNQQFSKDVLRERGFTHILKKFNVLDYANYKKGNWYESLNASGFWRMPFLCIINRCFLTSKEKYRYIKSKIDLVIHDECHSIENLTTQTFYNWLSEHTPTYRVIGFSATPENISPLNKIISKYSIYDAYKDAVILPPKVLWIKSEVYTTDSILITLIKDELEKLPYKKIIIWCGTIEECYKKAELWRNFKYFENYLISLDVCNKEESHEVGREFASFGDFYNSKRQSLLFCAVKHREGSDIPNVDGCIFMDKVEKRSQRVFVQSMGRVLRHDKDHLKTYGLVIDFKAKSTIEICNRVQYYLQLPNIFPWSYNLTDVNHDGVKYYINRLIMCEKKELIDVSFNRSSEQLMERLYTKRDIVEYFKRDIPDEDEYKERLEKEIELILEKNLFGNIVRALEILEMTKNIPHVTRGSCGSSLVCYLLGISHVDPVKYNISFARFINEYRNTLPDIDFDFPHFLRDEVFLKLFQKWGNKVARISNHNYFHEKSALRESLRRNGVRRFISKYELQSEISAMDEDLQREIYSTQKELDGQFRGYSLHCGGIIYFPEGVPEEYILENSNKNILKQVHLNKHDVADRKSFKIDVLSSRALSQLYYCHSFMINFEMNIGDQKTIQMLCSGDNIGITLAETPLMRKALLLIQPKSIMDLAICLAIIRPAAKDAKNEFELGKYRKDNIVFDDDAIQLIAKLLKCDEAKADKVRRGYCKNDEKAIELLDKYIGRRPKATQTKIKNMLNNLRKYGFCKAHALSYAQLVWQLAYQKAHHPEKFWKSTLRNTQTCYRKWVHIYEAHCNGVSVEVKNKERSIYANKRAAKLNNSNDNLLDQLRNYGVWNMSFDSNNFYPNCYCFKSNDEFIFRGLIANSRLIQKGKKRLLIVNVGVGPQEYIEVVIQGKFKFDLRKVIIQGKGTMKNDIYNTIESSGKYITFV